MVITTKKINSFAVALLLSVDALCYALPSLGIGTFYRLMYVIEAVAFGLVLIGKLRGKNHALQISVSKYGFAIAYFALIVLVCLISYFTVPQFSYKWDSFIFCFALGVLIVSVDFCVETVLTIMTVLSTLIIPCYSGFFAYQWETLNQASMGAVYAVLVWVVAGFCHFLWFRKNHKPIFYIFYIPSLVGGVGILQFANRGTVMALVTFVVLALFNRGGNVTDITNKEVMKKRIALIIAVALGFYVVLNFNQLFMTVYDFLDKILPEMPSFFVKMNKMISLEDIGNGRTDLYNTAIAGILESPLLGHGIESFEYYTGYAYEHNFVLQLLYEGGIFFCIVPFVTIVWTLYKLLFSQIKDREILAMLIFMTAQVIPRFLVSASIWTDRYFWLLIFYVFINRNRIREQRSVYGAGESKL